MFVASFYISGAEQMTVEDQRRRQLLIMNWMVAASALAALVSWGAAVVSIIQVFCK